MSNIASLDKPVVFVKGTGDLSGNCIATRYTSKMREFIKNVGELLEEQNVIQRGGPFWIQVPQHLYDIITCPVPDGRHEWRNFG